MGTLRLLLALAVVLLHLRLRDVATGGVLSVQLFYMISGFLITHVLVQNPAYRHYRTFQTARWLRLYPMYAVVAVAMLVVVQVLPPDFPERWSALPLAAQVLMVVTNLAILGQDWVMFLTASGDGLRFTADFWHTSPQLHHFLLVPPAWSLGIELSFYLIAPWLVLRWQRAAAVAAASLALRLVILKLGPGWSDPWTYRFFPTELALFLLGSLSWHLVRPWWYGVNEAARGRPLVLWATVVLWGACLAFGALPLASWAKGPMLIGLAFLLLPATFVFSGSRRWDREVGELSYPLYICHTLVIHMLAAWLPADWVRGGAFTPPAVGVTIAACLAVAWLLHVGIQRRVEALRRTLTYA